VSDNFYKYTEAMIQLEEEYKREIERMMTGGKTKSK
jgi:hypothetical protein